MSWVWRWLLLAAALTAVITTALPVPDEALDSSTKVLGSSVVTSVSVLMGQEDGNPEVESDRMEVTDDLPASTVDMLRPDGFQFYTVDEKGQLITRQMTDAEIQSIIAAAGGPLPIGAFDSQKSGENATGEMKVADVVQNVQNVLKEELNKPPVAMGTVPTIPGHASAEWSNILPSILGGDTDAETAPVSLPETGKPAAPIVPVIQDTKEDERIVETPSINPELPPLVPEEIKPANESPAPSIEAENAQKPVEQEEKPAEKIPEKEEKPTGEENVEASERPMVLVPVITTDSVHSTVEETSLSEDKPVYQILNTISADDAKNQEAQTSTERITEKPASQAASEEKPAVIPETTGVKITPSVPTEPQKEAEETTNTLPMKDAEETEAASEAEKQKTPDIPQETPSITLVAPAVTAEIPDEISAPVKSEKPAEEDKNEQNSTPVETTSEKEESMEEKVSEIVNMFPESINSIVEDLVSEGGIKSTEKLTGDEVKVEIAKPATASPAEPVVTENTKVEKEGETKVTDSSNRVEKPAVSNGEEPEKSDEKTGTIFEILPEIISRPTEATSTLEKIEIKPILETSAEKVEEKKPETTTTTKIANSEEEVTQSMISVLLTAPAPAPPQPDLQPPAVSTSAPEDSEKKNDSGSERPETSEEKEKPAATGDKKHETLLNELADSVSSVISQVSEVMPSMVPIPHESEKNDQSVKRGEDKVKPEVTTTTTTSETPKPTEAEIPTEKIELAEASKPEEIKSETTKISQSVPAVSTALKAEAKKPETPVKIELPAAVVESGSTEAISEVDDVPKPEAPAAAAIYEEGKIEMVKIPTMDSETKPEKAEDVPISQTAEGGTKVEMEKAENVPISQTAEGGTKVETPESSGSSDSEAPIVRIDITEAKPTDVSIPAIPVDGNDDSTESPVVRIQMTNPVATIDQMIDAAPDQTPPVDVEALSLPDNKIEAITAQNIGSSLIAGSRPENPAEVKPSAESPSPSLVPPTKPTLEDAVLTASADSDAETTSTAQSLPIDSNTVDNKPDVETQETKIHAVEIPQTIAEPKPTPEADEEANVKSPAHEIEAPKITEESETPKPAVEEQTGTSSPSEKVQETKATPTTAEPVVKIDLSVSNEEVESSEKSEESVAGDAEKIVEPPVVPAVISSKDEPAVSTEASVKVPSEVVVSTTVDVIPEKNKVDGKSPEAVDEDSTTTEANKDSSVIETVAKPDSETPATSGKTGSEDEVSETEKSTTKVAETSAPAAEQPEAEAETTGPVVAVSTEESESGKKDLPKTESDTKTSEPEIEVPDVVETQSEEVAESVEKQSEESVVKSEELPAGEGSSDAKGPEEDSVPTPVPEISHSLSDEEPAKEVSSHVVDVKEAEETKAKPEESTKPVVRIDVSPEKNQFETSTASLVEPEKTSVSDEKAAVTAAKKPTSEDAEPEKFEALFAPEATVGSFESSPVTPAKTESDLKEEEAKKEVKIPEESSSKRPQEEDVKETVGAVDSEHPVTNEEVIESVKPIVKSDESIPAKTQEIRIQVNDTAVLVTKHPISQEAFNVAENQTEKKPELGNPPASTIDEIKTPSQTLQPAKEPGEEDLEMKPQTHNSGKDEEKVEKTSAQTASSGIKKKPIIDPYVKLGETQEDSGAKKVPNKSTDNEGGKLAMENKWTLIPQGETYPVVKLKTQSTTETPADKKDEEPQRVSVPLDAHQSAVNLADSTRNLDKDIESFSSLCNELAFSFWTATNKGLSTARSLAISPFGMTSMLAMVFLGARGPTSGQMNDILKLDDVVTFNPHLVFQNVSDSVNLARGQGIANAAFVRELFADRSKAGRLLPFYKERAQQFYDGHVEEVNFATISDLVRRRTNLLIRRQTGGRIRDFVKGNVMPLRSPLAALSANVFQTDCAAASSEGREGEMYFAVLPAVRQRKLVPVPATVWKSGVLAGYEPGLDATVISLGGVDSLVSTIFLLPGQQGLAAPGDGLDHLERRLLEGAFGPQGVWDRLLKTLIPRMGLEVQVPKFSHRSIINATAALKRMGLDDLFSKHADLKGINGVGNDLHLADMVQINLFSTCGDETITGGRHHVEIYPASPLRESRGDKIAVDKNRAGDNEESELPVAEDLRARRSVDVKEYIEQSRDAKRSVSPSAEEELIDEIRSERTSFGSKNKSKESAEKQSGNPLLKLDRPFLYFVRHNPTGMILHMGRFNPRLMP